MNEVSKKASCIPFHASGILPSRRIIEKKSQSRSEDLTAETVPQILIVWKE
jgi:hypothetical protein